MSLNDGESGVSQAIDASSESSCVESSCVVCGTAMRRVRSWLSVCGHCGFRRASLTANAGSDIGGLEALRRRNFGLLLDRLSRVTDLPSRRLLEVGCSQGWFLDAAVQRGVARAVGIEPEAATAHVARGKGHDVRVGYFPDGLGADERFDLIVFNDVFEHLPDPAAMLRVCHERLEDGGLLVLNLPSSDGTLYRVAEMLARFGIDGPLERMWQLGLPSPHITYFNDANLRRFVEETVGLRPVDAGTLPSASLDGLWPRIRSSEPVPRAVILYAGLAGMLPLLRMLPQDIIVHAFRKGRA